MTKQPYIGTSYQPIGGGYAYCSMRVGLLIRSPQGAEIYVQPGDAENAMRANLDALDEVSVDPDNGKRALVADILLSEYFA